jgi:hypothetical protein
MFGWVIDGTSFLRSIERSIQMSATDPANLFPAKFDKPFFAGLKLFALLIRDSQSNLQSLVTFNLRQAENARLATDAFFSDVQPLLKTTNPANFVRAWLETAEKRSTEMVKRFRHSVDDLREELFKAAEHAVEDVASDTEKPAVIAPGSKGAAKAVEIKST